jgi:hypothetical protein
VRESIVIYYVLTKGTAACKVEDVAYLDLLLSQGQLVRNSENSSNRKESVEIDSEWTALFVTEEPPPMETAVAGRVSRVRPPRPVSESAANGFSFSQQSVTQSSSNGWLAASLIESNVWSSPPSPLMDLSMPVPRSRSIQVPHVRQLCNWDCGLACVLMVLKVLGVEGCDLKYLSQLCQTTSIWTVDLAHLLRHFKVEVAFLTVTIGANPNFAIETFYKENMQEDGERVNMLFEKAPQVGIRVQVYFVGCPSWYFQFF